MRTVALFTALALLLPAQQQQQQQTAVPDVGLKISVTTNLVVVNVDVRDKNGKAIENLKASDFTVTEDDKAQNISVFEYQRLETEAAPPEPPKIQPRPDKAKEEKPREVAPLVAKKAIAPSSPGQVRYKDRRLMVLFFDFSSMPQSDQLRAQSSALKFIDTQITPADMVAIMTFATQLNVVEDFTNDRDRLRDVIKGFRIGEGSDLAADVPTGDEDSEDDASAFTADESEFNIFNTDRKLSALESAAKMLASLPEKKALVYFSSGVGKTGNENQSQLRSTINAAVRSNVAFYPIDARGLVATAPGGDATSGSRRGSGLYSGSSQTASRTRFNDQQETLFTLAGDTGGKALLDNNDLSVGIQQAQKDIASYYILGYYSSNAKLDGKFRRIKVKLNNNATAKLDFRSGYFAGKEFKKFTTSDKERQLEEAILLGDPMTDLPMALEVDYFRIGKATYFVPLSVKIPGTAMELAKRGKSESAELDFIGQVRDAKGRLAATVRDGITVKLTGEDAAKLSRRNLEYDSGFTLPPGDYSVKVLARENVTGKMGTFETKFTVPDLSAQSPYLRTSSVVWSNQREPLSAAVGSAGRDRRRFENHPLIQQNLKLAPSITKVYRKDQNLYVYLEVYDPGIAPETKSPSVLASLSFFQGHAKAFQTEAVRVKSLQPSRSTQTVAVQFEIPLASLKAGRYTCQVNLVDEVGRKFAFSRAPMVLLNQ
jgi:VWFA-related protein